MTNDTMKTVPLLKQKRPSSNYTKPLTLQDSLERQLRLIAQVNQRESPTDLLDQAERLAQKLPATRVIKQVNFERINNNSSNVKFVRDLKET